MRFNIIPALLTTCLSLAAENPYGPHLVPRATCTVTALGGEKDDTPQIKAAFESCNNGGTVVFPEGQTYWIGSRLNPVISDVTIEWNGSWKMSDDLTYWRNHSYPIAFQNHHAGIIFSGDRIRINGYGIGGINGNGNAWYDDEEAITQPGRPMPFVWWNVSDVHVEHFFVKDPPLWSINIMNGTNMLFDDMYVNATATNAPYGTNWVQNTDGFDTMDSNNITLKNMVYQGGDDCIAIKPRSYNIYVQNITCHGGNGIAVGSLGQYLEDNSVANITVSDANIITYNEDMQNGAYIKTWVGALVPQPTSYESDYLPRGGGWGNVTNILFQNFNLTGPSIAAAITQDSGDNGSYAGTSKMLISNVAFVNFTGYSLSTSTTASVSCSDVHPCYNISFVDFEVSPGIDGDATGAEGKCGYILNGEVTGISGSGC